MEEADGSGLGVLRLSVNWGRIVLRQHSLHTFTTQL